MNIQSWFPLGLTGLISLHSKELSRVFSSTTVWKHQFFTAQPSLLSNSHFQYMTNGKTIALTIQASVGKVMSLLCNILSRFVIAFLPRSKHLLISWLQSLSTVILSSVQFSRSVVSSSLWPHGPQHARSLYPSSTPGVYSNSCPLSWWCHPTISLIPFSSHPQSFPASGSFPMSQFFTSGGQSIGVSASTSVLPMNIQDWFPSGWTGWISLQSKGLSRVFPNTTVQKNQFFGTQLSLYSNSHTHTRLLEKP